MQQWKESDDSQRGPNQQKRSLECPGGHKEMSPLEKPTTMVQHSVPGVRVIITQLLTCKCQIFLCIFIYFWSSFSLFHSFCFHIFYPVCYNMGHAAWNKSYDDDDDEIRLIWNKSCNTISEFSSLFRTTKRHHINHAVVICLMQQLSVAVHRGNTICISGTVHRVAASLILKH